MRQAVVVYVFNPSTREARLIYRASSRTGSKATEKEKHCLEKTNEQTNKNKTEKEKKLNACLPGYSQQLIMSFSPG